MNTYQNFVSEKEVSRLCVEANKMLQKREKTTFHLQEKDIQLWYLPEDQTAYGVLKLTLGINLASRYIVVKNVSEDDMKTALNVLYMNASAMLIRLTKVLS